jgi:hypothetical protein
MPKFAEEGRLIGAWCVLPNYTGNGAVPSYVFYVFNTKTGRRLSFISSLLKYASIHYLIARLR